MLCADSSPDIDVRHKALDIALQMVTSRNVEEVISLLKKDLIKTVEQDYEKVGTTRELTDNGRTTNIVKS